LTDGPGGEVVSTRPAHFTPETNPRNPKGNRMDFKTIGKKIASPEGVEMQLLSPGGRPFYAVQDRKTKKWDLTVEAETEGCDTHKCVVRVASKDSKLFRRRMHEVMDSLRKQKNVKAEAVERETLKTVAAAVVSWSNIIWPGEDGELFHLEFNDDNLFMFLSEYRSGYEQIDEFIAERANFFKDA